MCYTETMSVDNYADLKPASLEELILQKLTENDNSVFVFPSSVAADLWAKKVMESDKVPVLNRQRFIVWDFFKENFLSVRNSQKKPVSSLIRSFYAKKITGENRKAPFLSKLIPQEYSDDSGIFADWLGKLLPQLKNFEKLVSGKSRNQLENDLLEILRLYGDFLKENNLFEPSWEKAPFRDNIFFPVNNPVFYIVFPETLSDFQEYENLLDSCENIRLLPVSGFPVENSGKLFEFLDTRQEIEFISCLLLHYHHEYRIPFEEMAISVPSVEDNGEYLLRELRLKNIPFSVRIGKPLGFTSIGRFFSLVYNCYNENYSFASLKALLLNRVIPWKDRTVIEDLISFGIEMHCVTSWNEGGKPVDIWKAAFSCRPKFWNENWEFRKERLKSWFMEFSSHLEALAGARSFKNLLTAYMIFRQEFFDTAAFSPEENLVMGRCIEKLEELISLEQDYPDLISVNPCKDFVSVLNEGVYVPQESSGGVNVFPYRVAAGSPYTLHIVFGANQDDCTVVYPGLDGIPSVEKSLLYSGNKNPDRDVSIPFFLSYILGSILEKSKELPVSGAVFTCASETFNGYKIPHVYFQDTGKNTKADFNFDKWSLFRDEKQLILGDKYKIKKLFPVQQRGFLNWYHRKSVSVSDSLLKAPFKDSPEIYNFLLNTKRFRDGLMVVSQSDLKEFYKCPASWFFRKFLRIEEMNLDSILADEKNIGTAVHEILEKFYFHIKETGKSPEDCISLLETFAGQVINSDNEFSGPLAKPVFEAMKEKLIALSTGIIQNDEEKGFTEKIISLEQDLYWQYKEIIYHGKIDKITLNDEDSLTLIDYKTGELPPPQDYTLEPSSGAVLEDFQMPVYVTLAENSPGSVLRGRKIGGGVFVGKNSVRVVFPCKNCTRDNYENILMILHENAETFVERIKKLDFTVPEEVRYESCLGCGYRTLCRNTYRGN